MHVARVCVCVCVCVPYGQDINVYTRASTQMLRTSASLNHRSCTLHRAPNTSDCTRTGIKGHYRRSSTARTRGSTTSARPGESSRPHGSLNFMTAAMPKAFVPKVTEKSKVAQMRLLKSRRRRDVVGVPLVCCRLSPRQRAVALDDRRACVSTHTKCVSLEDLV
jgi:hypothetical protein